MFVHHCNWCFPYIVPHQGLHANNKPAALSFFCLWVFINSLKKTKARGEAIGYNQCSKSYLAWLKTIKRSPKQNICLSLLKGCSVERWWWNKNKGKEGLKNCLNHKVHSPVLGHITSDNQLQTFWIPFWKAINFLTHHPYWKIASEPNFFYNCIFQTKIYTSSKDQFISMMSFK